MDQGIEGHQQRALDLITQLTGGVQPRRPHQIETDDELVAFVDSKPLDLGFFAAALRASEEANQWTNFGPVSLVLERAIAEYLQVPDDRRVVMCASGTAALFGLIYLRRHIERRPLRWVVSDFGFSCSRQGPLGEALAIDCHPETGMLGRDAVEAAGLGDGDGVLVTNVFGLFGERAFEVVEHCHQQGIPVIVDSAGAFDISRREVLPAAAWEVLSFHHTKPWGMGEGGAAIVPAELEDTFRSVINFGLYRGIDTGSNSMNGKLSELAAAAIMQRLCDLPTISAICRREHERVRRVAEGVGFRPLSLRDAFDKSVATPAGVVLVGESAIPVQALENDRIVLHKYYRPLQGLPAATSLYDRIVVFPSHPGMASVGGDVVEDVLAGVLERTLSSR